MYSLVREMMFMTMPPEKAHRFSMNRLKNLCNIAFTKKILEKAFRYNGDDLAKDVFGLHFKNPVGLGAGFDKNALYLKELEVLGFSHVEVGTITPLPQPGNEQPRLFRLPQDKALINRMGFNNNGVKAVRGRLEMWKLKNENKSSGLIVGGNIGKNKATANEDAWLDYATCFNELFDAVDYFVVNVSSPNTPGLRALQEKDALQKILFHLQNINSIKQRRKPLLLKIAPDLTPAQMDDIISLASAVKLDGLVATNTTVSRERLKTKNLQDIGAGGLSGKPLQQRSTEIVKHISGQTKGKLPIIASGGIFTGADAKEKLDAGASLVQVWTGFIYEGPFIVKNICRNLAK